MHRRRERADGKRLGEPGDTFEQHVAVGEQADEQPVHELFLADDDARDFLTQHADPGGSLRDLVFQRGVHAA